MKIEKIELKHLAAYLPYGVEVHECFEEYGHINQIKKLTSCNDCTIFCNDEYYGYDYNEIELILLPLEKAEMILIECIRLEFKNQKYITNFTKDSNYFFGEYVYIEFSNNNQEYYVTYSTRMNCFLYRNFTTNTSYNICLENAKMIEKFLENHVDIFGLIENGLAIDKTTLKS